MIRFIKRGFYLLFAIVMICIAAYITLFLASMILILFNS